jgi:TRAP-type C4-dicarboxylate transport system permease small subunit
MSATESKEVGGYPSASEDLDVLFKEWEKEEAKVDLSDLTLWDGIVFALFWILFAVVFLQLFARYALNNSPGWTEEIARYLLIGVTFVGSVTAMRKGTHIAVEALFKYLGATARHWLLVAVDLVVALFCIFLAITAAQLSLRTNQFMVSVDISKAWVYWTVCASFVAMTIYAALRLVRRLQRSEADEVKSLPLD